MTGQNINNINGCRIYVDIMTGQNCRQFRLLTWTSFIGQPIGMEEIW